MMTGIHGATIYDDGGQVQPGSGHENARHDFITRTEEDHSVQHVGLNHDFDAGGNDFAGRENIMHAVMALGDAVTAADGAEFTRRAAVFLNPGTDVSGNAF